MKRIFIDCGYWNGLSTKFFQETHPEASEFSYYGFECSPRVLKEKQMDVFGVTLIPKMVWTRDGEDNFYTGPGEGSSAMKEKRTGILDRSRPIKVPCIDFSKWLRKKFSRKDYIIVKMNIEGAEYPIIEKMAKDDTLSWINIIYIAWHYKKMRMEESTHKHAVNLVRKSRVSYFSWNLNHDKKNHLVGDFRERFLESIKMSETL